MNAKNKAPKSPAKIEKAPASEVSAPTATLEASAPAAPVSGFRPVVKGSGAGFAPRVPGFLGYGKNTGTEALALSLSAPEGATKEALVSRYVEVTGKPEKAAKSSLSVFLSDSVRPFGRYYASRSLSLETDGTLYRFSPESIEKAEGAVKAGALEVLKTVPEKDRTEVNPKYRAFLSRFGYTLPE